MSDDVQNDLLRKTLKPKANEELYVDQKRYHHHIPIL